MNSLGKTQIKYSYGAYGETVSTVIGWNNPVTNPYRYNAERIDDVAGVPAFQYLRARYLNPYTSSFLSQDSYLGSLLIPLSQNRYAYAHNNPVMYTDPSGHYVKTPNFYANVADDGTSCGTSGDDIPPSEEEPPRSVLYEFTQEQLKKAGMNTLIDKFAREARENCLKDSCTNGGSSSGKDDSSDLTSDIPDVGDGNYFNHNINDLYFTNKTVDSNISKESAVSYFKEIDAGDYSHASSLISVLFPTWLSVLLGLHDDYTKYTDKATVDPEGRLLYLEEGYTVVEISRVYIGSGYSATETEYFIFDKKMELVFDDVISDTYITD